MKRFFTSDWHINSRNINVYAKRPWADAASAMEAIIKNANDVASKHDTIIHVGDFILDGADNHDTVSDVCAKPAKLDRIMERVEANLILMSGNHDDGHNCETICKSMFVDLNQNYHNVYVNHFPSSHPNYKGPRGHKNHILVNLCGHVHDSWVAKYDFENYTLNINVGIDAWNYKPVSDAELTEFLDWVFDRNHTGNGADFTMPWTWTNEDVIAFKNIEKFEVEKRRLAHKQERYAKKGLTPEECERRKIDAMVKKGLLPKAEMTQMEMLRKLNADTKGGLRLCKDALDACGYTDVGYAKARAVVMDRIKSHVDAVSDAFFGKGS